MILMMTGRTERAMVGPFKEVRMRALTRVVMIIAVLAVISAPVLADDLLPEEPERRPGAALTAAFGNLVFLPVRLGLTIFGGLLGGFTGFMTAGNYEAADDVWNLFEGQNILTPDIVDGKEALRFGNLEFSSGARPE